MNKIKMFKNVIFINFGGIGDEILFFPTIQDFKVEYPDCKITLLLEPRSASCARLTTLIDETITYDVKSTNKVTAFLKLITILRAGHYDAVISSGSNKLIGLMLFLSGIKTRIGYDTGTLSHKLLSTAVALNKHQYATGMYHDLLKGIGIDRSTPLPEISVDDETLSIAKKLIGEQDKPSIIIHPGVSKLSVIKKILKSWPEEKWFELINNLLKTNKYKVILAGGPDDETVIMKIREKLNTKNIDTANFVDLYGQTKNLQELAAVIKLSDVLVCVDSAPMHIGVGVRTKIVAIFGPTDENKLLPKNKDFQAITKSELSCRPCLWDKRNEVCDQPSCLEVDLEQVLNAIVEQLNPV